MSATKLARTRREAKPEGKARLAIRIRYDDGLQRTVVIAEHGEEDPEHGVISLGSPLGSALTQSPPDVGDTVTFLVGGVKRYVTVLEITPVYRLGPPRSE